MRRTYPTGGRGAGRDQGPPSRPGRGPATWAGVVYIAFVVDTFSRLIVGWSAATVKATVFVLDAVEMAIWQRDRDQHPVRPGELIHHSDAGSQGGFNWSSQHLDHGGVRWDGASDECWRRRRVLGGSGQRIGRSGHRCVPRGGRSRLARCSGSSGA
ncbi:DDE-type integrase/transposase/recombinase [Streptomyces mirabilis]